jgi:hypothetical protein
MSGSESRFINEESPSARGMTASAASQQCASAVVMIRPAAFDYNPETAATNKMQQLPEPGSKHHVAALGGGLGPEASVTPAAANDDSSAGSSSSAAARALDEFDGFVRALRSEGVSVCAFADPADPPKPDAVFPNNWVSFHADGTVVLYPMQAESRRWERNPGVIEAVERNLGYKVRRVIDLSHREAEGRFLEGTGSLVLDHVERVAYACLSPRTDAEVVDEWCREMGYDSVVFSAVDRSGVPVYHTNVMLCIGARAVVVGGEAIVEKDRGRVMDRLRATGREIIEIGQAEIGQFAGNMLELASWDEALGDYRVLVMSDAARHALSREAFARLSASTDEVLTIPVPTIERLGGGSVRCMMAEVFV